MSQIRMDAHLDTQDLKKFHSFTGKMQKGNRRRKMPFL